MNERWQRLVGKKIRIYPNDTYKKIGLVIAVDEIGIWLQADKESKDPHWENGEVHFISWSNNVHFMMWENHK